MKKITTLIFLILISYNSYSQTFNDYSNPQILFAENVVRDWSVMGVGQIKLPLPVYDESTSWGRCMNTATRTCAASVVCSVGFAAFSSGFTAGWALGCMFRSNQTIIPHIKTTL